VVRQSKGGANQEACASSSTGRSREPYFRLHLRPIFCCLAKLFACPLAAAGGYDLVVKALFSLAEAMLF
jgi:hypothetical protein